MSTSENSSAEASQGNALTWLQNLLKLATAGLGLVAAIGLPAVAIHLSRFDVPLVTATYQDVIHAGVLPTMMLILVTAYCIAAGKVLLSEGWRRFLGFYNLFLLLPILVPAAVFTVVGFISYCLVIIWAILWSIHYLFEHLLYRLDISNRQLLLTSAGLLVTGYVMFLVLKITYRRWAHRKGRFWTLLRRTDWFGAENLAEPATKGSQMQEGKGAATPQKQNSKWEWLIHLVLIPGFALWAYCIKWLAYLWDPGLGGLLTHKHILLGSITFGIFVGLAFAWIRMMIWAAKSSGEKAGPRHRKKVIAAGAIVYVVLEVTYSLWGYPRLYSGLGGGRPQAVILWLKQEEDASDILSVLKGAEITSAGNLKRIGKVFVLLNGDKDLLITDAFLPPGKALLISRSRVMATSW